MKPIVLWFVVRLNPLWRVLGADPVALRAIVDVKLTMDNRRSYASIGRYGQSKTGEKNNQFLIVLAMYAFFGLFTGLSMLAIPPKEALFIPLTVTFGYLMVFCAMTLLSDFSSLLLDSADNQIILPRPVSGRTLLLSRIVHIAGYLFSIAIALSLVGLIVVTFRFGLLAGIVFLIMSLLSSILMVFLTNVFYLLLMQFTSEERLREVINYFQIVMAIVFYGSYQLVPRLMDRDTMMEAVEWQNWFYLVPPMWMAGAVDMVVQPAFDGPHALLTVLAVVLPFAGLWVMNRVLGPVFNARLAGLEQDSTPATIETGPEQTSSMMQRLSRLLTNNPLERAAFGFTWRVTARDRKFKLKTYPQLGFGLAYIIAMSVGDFGAFGKSGGFYLFALYYTGLFVMTAQYQLSASDDFKAAWVYGSAPISRPGEILSGAMKALIAKLMVPFYVLVAIYIAWRFGLDKIDDIVLAFSNSLIMSLISAMVTERRLPFSMAQDVVKRSNTARGFVVLFILGLIAGVHYGLTLIPYGVWVAVPFSVGIFWYLFSRYRQTGWAQIALE
jgi:ABC-2 type transport system permease protein